MSIVVFFFLQSGRGVDVDEAWHPLRSPPHLPFWLALGSFPGRTNSRVISSVLERKRAWDEPRFTEAFCPLIHMRREV